ncbi:MAG TPA: flagellar biosynthesis anti-sigma factor FlgM [Tepidisphaeraceae bacterium]|jgi:anti-sigma28 factor (negative regulator of flagellin synthesis)
MNVNAVNGNAVVSKNFPTVRREIPSDSSSTSGPAAVVDLSGGTQAASSDVRADKVATIKAAIANGTYETDDKINGAVNNMLDDVLS